MGLTQPLGKLYDEIMCDITTFGGFVFSGLVVLAMFALRLYFFAFILMVGFATLMAAVIVIRMVYFRERPEHVPYTTLIEKIDASSFPSLHTARMVYLALFLATTWPEVLWQVLMAFIAIMVAYSRIYLRKHDWIDVAAGAGLGAVVFFIFLKIMDIFFYRIQF